MAEEEKRNYPFLTIKTRESTRTSNGRWILYGNKKVNKEKNINVVLEREKINYFRDNILTNHELSRAPSGLYTWIMRGTENNNNFYASHTRSKQELGTLHKNLVDLTNYKDKRPLFAAGELKIDNNGAIEFNLQSGLFDTTVLKSYKTNNMKRNFVINKVVPTVINTLNRAGVGHVEYLDCYDDSCDKTEKTGGTHLLSKAPIISTEKNIDIYSKYFNRVNSGLSNGGSRSLRFKKYKRNSKKRNHTKKRK